MFVFLNFLMSYLAKKFKESEDLSAFYMFDGWLSDSASAHYQLMLNLSSTDIPKSFYSGLLSSHSPPSLYLYLGLPQPRCRTFHLALLNFMRLAWAHLSNQSRSHPSGVSTASLSLVSSAELLQELSVPLSTPPTKILSLHVCCSMHSRHSSKLKIKRFYMRPL